MAATLARLKDLHEKVGDVDVDKLLRAAKKDGLKVTRDLVKDYLSTDAPAQIFRKLPESKGKTGAEAQGFRLQADLIDYKTRKATWNGTKYSVVLVIMDVASRRVWALPAKTKAPQHIGPVLYRMIRTIKNAPGMEQGLGVITTDQGAEFSGASANVLENEGITHRIKDPQDPNAISTLDRAIQTIKRRLAQSLAGKSGPWPSRVAQVVLQYNNTFHPAIRDEPGDFNDKSHAVKRFLVEQDNAEKLQHNQQLLEKRTERLKAEGGYRVPVGGVSKFRRSFHQSYSGDVKEVDKVQGSVVQDKQSGEKHDIKRVMAVNVFSGKAEAGMKGTSARDDRIKDALLPLMTHLFAYLDAGERISLSAAAEEIKRHIGKSEYSAIMRRAGFAQGSGVAQLARSVALFDEEFEVEPGGYYLRKVG